MNQARQVNLAAVLVLIFALITMLTALPALGQGPVEWGQEDFDDPDMTAWQLFQGAEIAEGMLLLPPGGYAMYPAEWQHIGAMFRIHMDEGAALAMIYRASPEGANILLIEAEHLELQKEINGRVEQVATPVIPLPPPDPEGWWHIGLNVTGPHHIVEVNGEVVIDYVEDEAALPGGPVTLESIGQNLVGIDLAAFVPPEELGEIGPIPPGEWFEEEFEDGMPDWEGEWSENWDVAEGVASIGDEGGFLHHPGPFGDMLMHVRLRWGSEEGHVGLFFRASEEQTHNLIISPDNMHLEVPIPDSEEVIILGETDRNLGTDWHNIFIRLEGEQCLVILDDDILFEEQIPEQPGGLGVFLEGPGPLEVDRISVTPLEPLEALLGEEAAPMHEEQVPEEEEPVPSGMCYVSSTQAVNIRSGPNLNHPVIDILNPGTVLEVDGRSVSNWWHVAISEAERGWVFADVVQASGEGCATVPTIADGTEGQAPQQPPAQPPAQQPPAQPPPAQPPAQQTAPPTAQWQTDTAITDLFLEGSGRLNLRITNNGPGNMNNVSVPVQCEASGTDQAGGGQTTRAPVNWVFTATAAPGQTATFPTNWTFDTNAYAWTVTCRLVNPTWDPNAGNNTFSETYAQTLQAQILRADLAVTDIFPQSLPQGDVYVRVTNNGPDAVQGAVAGLNCTATIHTYKLGDPTTSAGSSHAITVNLQPGATQEFHSGIGITDVTQYWYEFTCEVNLPVADPNASNNSYYETIPPPP